MKSIYRTIKIVCIFMLFIKHRPLQKTRYINLSLSFVIVKNCNDSY